MQILGQRLLLVPRRAGGGVDGGRRGTTRMPTDGSRLGDTGGDGGPALGAGPTSVRHGHDGRRRTKRWKTNSGAPLPGAPNVGFRVPADPKGSNSGVRADILPSTSPSHKDLTTEGTTQGTQSLY